VQGGHEWGERGGEVMRGMEEMGDGGGGGGRGEGGGE